MKFIHLSFEPFLKFKKPRNLGKDVKPRGALWVAKGRQWREFIDENEWEEKYSFEYEFDIDISKVIQLKTYEDIALFTEKYGIDHVFGRNKNYIIDWEKVRKDTSGIYIKNAQIRKARLDFIWYSSFDVESVAIWDPDAILSFTALSSPRL
jgi:hypothetical protein